MDAVGAYEILNLMIVTVLKASAPVLVIALLVGLGIAFFQALTQIQEMTLTFVPKIIAIFGTVALAMPFIFETLSKLSNQVFDLIINGGI